MKKKFLAAAIGAMLVGGSAFAAQSSTVRVSGDGVGDLLIAPAYFIGGSDDVKTGMSTELKVINTSLTKSVVAKVVFHHPINSGEILDFLIYLTPGDVWKGTVSCLEGNQTQCTKSQVSSADDSIQYDGRDAFASDVSGQEALIISGGNGRTALPNYGYVTITESRALDVPNPQGKLAPGVLKTALKAAYDALELSRPRVGDDETPDVLTGTVTVGAPNVVSATLPLTAISNFDNIKHQVINGNTGLESHHAIADVEDAIWGNGYVVPYKVPSVVGEFSIVTFAFPTKLTYNGFKPDGTPDPTVLSDGQYVFGTSTIKDAIGAGVGGGADVGITAIAFNNKEETIAATFTNVSPLPPSKSILIPEFGWKSVGTDLSVGTFKEGWLNVSYSSPQIAKSTQSNGNVAVNSGRSGAPALVTVLNRQGGNFTWAYAAASGK